VTGEAPRDVVASTWPAFADSTPRLAPAHWYSCNLYASNRDDYRRTCCTRYSFGRCSIRPSRNAGKGTPRARTGRGCLACNSTWSWPTTWFQALLEPITGYSIAMASTSSGAS
jgi:hypothetical protein